MGGCLGKPRESIGEEVATEPSNMSPAVYSTDSATMERALSSARVWFDNDNDAISDPDDSAKTAEVHQSILIDTEGTIVDVTHNPDSDKQAGWLYSEIDHTLWAGLSLISTPDLKSSLQVKEIVEELPKVRLCKIKYRRLVSEFNRGSAVEVHYFWVHAAFVPVFANQLDVHEVTHFVVHERVDFSQFSDVSTVYATNGSSSQFYVVIYKIELNSNGNIIPVHR